MKRLACLILVLAMLLALSACGEPDPNAGLYEAGKASMDGISIDVNSVYPGGLSFELKDGGRAVMHMDGSDYNLKWKLEGEAVTIIAADTELSGTMSGGVMTLDMGSGVTIEFNKAD